MLTPESIQQYQSQSLTRAGYCLHCTKPLSSTEVYCCESCARELEHSTDPNFAMRDEEDGQS
ncbi:TPA: protein NinF [Escherichia coli]|nr:hypothetical protein [Escherichia coli]HCO3884079.1 hypothetical protein [Escherichia coli]